MHCYWKEDKKNIIIVQKKYYYRSTIRYEFLISRPEKRLYEIKKNLIVTFTSWVNASEADIVLHKFRLDI